MHPVAHLSPWPGDHVRHLSQVGVGSGWHQGRGAPHPRPDQVAECGPGLDVYLGSRDPAGRRHGTQDRPDVQRLLVRDYCFAVGGEKANTIPGPWEVEMVERPLDFSD